MTQGTAPPRRPIASLIAIVAALMAAPAQAGRTAVAPRPLSVEPGSGITFGALVVGAAGGSVRIDPRGGSTCDGAVHLRDAFLAGPARFTVRGEPRALFDVVLPESLELQVGGHGVTLERITSDVGYVGTLDAAGHAEIAIGATLRVPSRTPAGSYSGTLTVILAYE